MREGGFGFSALTSQFPLGVKQSCEIQFGGVGNMVLMQRRRRRNYAKTELVSNIIPIKF